MSYAKREVIHVLHERMKALKFRKRAGLTYTTTLAEGYTGSFSVAAATQGFPKDCASLMAYVGVRDTEVMNTRDDIAGRKRHSYYPSTITTPLHLLMPSDTGLEWVLTQDDAQAARVLNEIADKFEDFGLPWMRERTTRDAVVEQLRTFTMESTSPREILPVIARLEGREDEALQMIDALEREHGHATTPYSYAADVDDFVRRFRATSPTV